MVNKYILKEFFPNFFSIFTILVTIISLIFIVYISNVTSSFQITFLELLKMYFLTLPQILFISISIAFFISAINTFSSLSETQELIAFFSLGFSPKKLLKPVFILALIFTFFNLFILFISIPYSKLAFKNFKIKKQQEAKFSLINSKTSQKLGEWNIFSDEKNIFLFNLNKNQFIIAKNANLNTKSQILKFNLKNGKVYDFNKSFEIIFKEMTFQKIIPQTHLSIFNLKNYFQYNKKTFRNYFPFALLPLALLFFIPLFSFFHPRLNKNNIAYPLVVIALYVTFSFTNKNYYLAPLIPVIFFIIGFILYKRRIRF